MSYRTFNCDFHLHGLYSSGVSKKMKIPTIAEEAKNKGLDLVVTADILHPKWLSHCKNNLEEEGSGIYSFKGTNFLVGTELRDKNKVDHVVLLPNLESAEKLRNKLTTHSKDIDSDGRPFLYLDGEEIADKIHEVEGLIGPAHAFTPFYGIYAHFDSYKDCYGSEWVDFLELGLSADSNLADHIEELEEITFLSNSDAHSPWPFRLGREFNKLKMKGLSFEEVKKALKRKDGRKPVLNVGLDPREGKYHLTACQNCQEKFEMKYAQSIGWQCPECGGSIKKGVRDRIIELGNEEASTPSHRPPDQHLIPLSEIIAQSIGISSLYSKKVKKLWKKFNERFGSETRILLETPVQDLKEVHPETGRAIKTFRKEEYLIDPGGGGEYGEIFLPKSKEERKKIEKRIKGKTKGESRQNTLDQY